VPTVFLSYRHEDDAHRARVRDLAVRCAEGYLEARKELGFPLLKTDG